MKINTSKLANKDDLIGFIAIPILLFFIVLIVLLISHQESFLAGFVAATFVFKWQAWLYKPIDSFLERHWPPD